MNRLQSTPTLRFREFKKAYESSSISSLAKVYDGTHQTPTYVGNGVPFYSVEHVTSNQFTKTKYITEEVFQKESKRVSLEQGDILMSRIGDVGTVKYIDWEVRASFYVSLALFKGKGDINTLYLAHYISAVPFQRELWSRMIHVAFPKKINLGEISHCKASYPSDEKEQQKIADFLTAVDSKISQLTEKHRLLKEYKKGVMQQLFSQQIRFKDDDGKAFPDWEEKPLSKVLTEYKSKTTLENEHDVLTSSRNGLMMQSDYYSEGRITERSNVGFHVIPHGYLTYRSRSDDRMFFFNLNELGKTGIISHYYPVFAMNNGQNHFFVELTRYHSKIFGKYAVGTSQVVLSYGVFCKIKLQFPCAREQQKISQFLKSIDKKIDAIAEQIEQTKLFKKGLLQQMFV